MWQVGVKRDRMEHITDVAKIENISINLSRAFKMAFVLAVEMDVLFKYAEIAAAESVNSSCFLTTYL